VCAIPQYPGATEKLPQECSTMTLIIYRMI
jgi:hypothetical protein